MPLYDCGVCKHDACEGADVLTSRVEPDVTHPCEVLRHVHPIRGTMNAPLEGVGDSNVNVILNIN